MTTAKRSSRLRELFALLEKDRKSLYRKYPDQAIFTLADPQVTAAIAKRFEQNVSIKNIQSLDYDFVTGLNRLYFEFALTSRNTVLPSRDAFLTVVDANCKVLSIIDPFDPDQPNPFLPQLPKEGEQPFVLSRRSITEDAIFSEQELYPLQVRSREFFQKLTAGGSGPALDLIKINETRCRYTTQVGNRYREDETNDDCGFPPILA